MTWGKLVVSALALRVWLFDFLAFLAVGMVLCLNMVPFLAVPWLALIRLLLVASFPLPELAL